MLILVTGGNGFVGSHLVEALLAQEHQVRCLVRRTSDLSFIASLPLERVYGTLEIHSPFQEAVRVAGQNALARFGLTEGDRIKPDLVSVKMVSKVNPYEAQLVNKTSRGGLLLADQTLCVMEVEPAAYIMLAANEAEKAAHITLVHYQPSGRYGRLYIAGTDSEVKVARDAAIQAIKGI